MTKTTNLLSDIKYKFLKKYQLTSNFTVNISLKKIVSDGRSLAPLYSIGENVFL